MSDTVQTPGGDQKPRLRGLAGAVAYFLLVGLGVVGVYMLFPPESPSDAVPETEATSTTSSTSTTTLPQPTVVVDTSSPGSGDEPVADAAAIIIPSVVHVQTPGGVGSGVIYSEGGIIVTAAHIIRDAEDVRVRFYNGEQADGTVIGIATEVDIAVIQVNRTGLAAATFSVERPRVGQLAIAVGSPFTLESTVTAGIISAVDRANCDDNGLCLSMIQTDAAINPGNSGGALVNRHGHVVGINVSIFSQTGSNEGVGFAIPSETVIAYAEGIIAGAPIEAGFLGVRGGYSPGDQAGALITEVLAGTAAEEAGVMVNDVVIFLEGVSIQGIDDLAAQVRRHQPGQTVMLVLIREGTEMTVEVTLGEAPEESG